ncbi:MAG: DUF4058 family protein [Planctomycetia bacterium]|nr:DUF4058 family protein [Planctomycetia bacterium]
MPIHDWTRVNAGTFHHFHAAWITHLSEALNDRLLPEGFYALAAQQAIGAIPDVLALATPRAEPLSFLSGAVAVAEAPPRVSVHIQVDEMTHYRLARRTLSIRHVSGHRVVALLEIVSPANKDRAKSVAAFVDKAYAAINQHLHLLVIDLLPPGPADPRGMHGAIWQEVGGGLYEPPSEKPLTLAAYTANGMPEAYLEPTCVGAVLIDMPLFLDEDFYVNVPLERTYQAAYRGMPEYWRNVIEGRDN